MHSRRILVVDDNSPTAPGQIADRLAAADDRGRGCFTARASRASGRPTWPAFARALDGGRGAGSSRWTPTSPTIPPYLPRADRGDRATPTWCSARATSRRRRHRVGAGAAVDQPRRQPVRAGRARLQVRDLTGGFKCFRREVLEAIDLDTVDVARLRLPGGDDLPRDQARVPGGGGADHVQRPARRDLKMSRAIVAEAIWRVPAMRFGAAGELASLCIVTGRELV